MAPVPANQRSRRRPLWTYPLFQLPLLSGVLWICAASLSGWLSWGQPTSVVVALDLSSSTYATPDSEAQNRSAERFNQPDTLSHQQVQALYGYLDRERQRGNLAIVQALGFAGEVVPLTEGFSSDIDRVRSQIEDRLAQTDLLDRVSPNHTNLNLALSEATERLQGQPNRRELLIVSDGEVDVADFFVQSAREQDITVHTMSVGRDAPSLQQIARQTGGVYRTGDGAAIAQFFEDSLYHRQLHQDLWQLLCYCGILLSFLWLLTLPCDRWLLQDTLRLPMNRSGRIALLLTYGGTGGISVWFVREVAHLLP